MIVMKRTEDYDPDLDIPTRIGVTGSPGTGKKSIGLALSKMLGLSFLSVNEYAKSYKIGHWNGGEFEVDTVRLKGKIPCEGRVVVGHLLPYVLSPKSLQFVAILRCSPSVLRKRYAERGYSTTKIQENLQAEALDIISQKAFSTFGRKKVSEFDTTMTRNPQTTAQRIVATIRGKRSRTFGTFSWLEDAKSEGRLRLMLMGEASVGRGIQY